MEWLYELEIYQIIFTLAGGGLLVTAVIPALIRWKFKLEPSEAFGKGADDAFKLIISITLETALPPAAAAGFLAILCDPIPC